MIEHEYAHGLSTRYVAGGEALGSQQAGSMGEGWGDWYGLNYLHREGLYAKSVVGEYVTGNPVRGIRNWAYDDNPTNFGDIGYDLTGPEVHADGEIWTATLWELRKKLVAQYGQAQGSEVAARLVTDAMPLSAPDPSFLDMRDAILAADTDRYHGANTDAIWTVFAHRGAGASASSATGDDTNPTAGVRPRGGRPQRDCWSARVVNGSTGEPVTGAKVIVGEFEARVTPLVRTSTTGGFGAKMVAGSYDLLDHGTGLRRPAVPQRGGDRGADHVAGASPSRPTSRRRRPAPSGSTCRARTPGLPAEFLLDDTAASVWARRRARRPTTAARTSG